MLRTIDPDGELGKRAPIDGRGWTYSTERLASTDASGYKDSIAHPDRRLSDMNELTPRQRQILILIQECISEKGMPPTRAEIAAELGFKSANAAEEHLRALQRKGVVELIPGASRGIQLKDSLREQLGLPLIGRVAAGRPMLAEEHIEGRYQIDPKIFQPKAHYLLKVRGMSMKDIGIMDGDLVAVHRTPEVRNRQIVVARLDDEVTVKRYKQDGKVIWLLPENEEFEPIRVDLKEQSLIIEGIVVGVLRHGKSKALFQ
jgi:repressor LexA